MILFACARDALLPEIQRYGFRFSGLGHKLYRTLEGAKKDCASKILVVQLGPTELEACTVKERAVVAPLVALDAFRNLNPYLPPKPVAAGGGLIVRKHHGEYEVLCIHRRGVWDLPKGKQDKEEAIEECALREVREELGIGDVEIVSPAGHTIHGYPRSSSYHVKTTHWYWMRTEATSFEPQAEEQIDDVQWIRWDEAAATVGYRTLRELLRTARPADADV